MNGNGHGDHSGPSRVEAGYVDAMSRDHVVDAYSRWFDLTAIERTCIDLVVSSDSKVLDLGCGAGRFAKAVVARSSQYLGLDASEKMLDAARKLFPQADFALADIVNYVPDRDWNVLLLMGNVLDCLHPLDRRHRMLENCHQWMRTRGGTVIGSSHLSKTGASKGYVVEDYHGATIQNYRSSLPEIHDELQRLGFVVDLLARDYRGGENADWIYWIARVPRILDERAID